MSGVFTFNIEAIRRTVSTLFESRTFPDIQLYFLDGVAVE